MSGEGHRTATTNKLHNSHRRTRFQTARHSSVAKASRGIEVTPSRVLPPVSVVIPAYDEEGGVAAQVESIRRVLIAHGMTYEIVVVDDGSSDRTAQEALGAGARVLQHPQNRGYGASLKTGINAARYDTIVITDA